MKIYLDDLRPIPEGYTGARNVAQFKALVEQAKKDGTTIAAISFDNDLGEGEPEGYDAVKWLADAHPELIVGDKIELNVHSANPKGVENMEAFIANCRAHKEDLLEAASRPNPWGGEIER